MEKRFTSPVEIKKNITPEDFRKYYLLKEKPVVLRGLWENYPARRKWSIPYFKEKLGEIEVGVFDGLMQKEDRSFKVPDKLMKFTDYLDAITSDNTTDLRLFLFNIFRYNPDLKKDFGYPPLTKLYLKRVPFMFFGGKNSKVRLHEDMDWSNVFLTQLHGRKEVVLFHPKYSRLLYRYPFSVHSSVNIEDPDYESYPGLKYVEGVHCILEPGDTLFIPSGYWHYIKYLEGGFAISLRALSPKPSRWLTGIWHVIVLTNVDEVMRWLLGGNWHKIKTRISRQLAEKECLNITGV